MGKKEKGLYGLYKKEKEYDHKDTLEKLKALGDETRLRIIELIIEKLLSASELSLLLNLTIPTIAHNLKVLVANELIGTYIENEGVSKVTYKIFVTTQPCPWGTCYNNDTSMKYR